jgi:hypothetical protein
MCRGWCESVRRMASRCWDRRRQICRRHPTHRSHAQGGIASACDLTLPNAPWQGCRCWRRDAKPAPRGGERLTCPSGAGPSAHQRSTRQCSFPDCRLPYRTVLGSVPWRATCQLPRRISADCDESCVLVARRSSPMGSHSRSGACGVVARSAGAPLRTRLYAMPPICADLVAPRDG